MDKRRYSNWLLWYYFPKEKTLWHHYNQSTSPSIDNETTLILFSFLVGFHVKAGLVFWEREQLKMNTPDLFSPVSYKGRLLVLKDQLKMNTSDLFSRDSETLPWENIKKFPNRLFSSPEYVWPPPLHKMFTMSVHVPTNIFKMSALFHYRKCLKYLFFPLNGHSWSHKCSELVPRSITEKCQSSFLFQWTESIWAYWKFSFQK